MFCIISLNFNFKINIIITLTFRVNGKIQITHIKNQYLNVRLFQWRATINRKRFIGIQKLDNRVKIELKVLPDTVKSESKLPAGCWMKYYYYRRCSNDMALGEANCSFVYHYYYYTPVTGLLERTRTAYYHCSRLSRSNITIYFTSH